MEFILIMLIYQFVGNFYTAIYMVNRLKSSFRIQISQKLMTDITSSEFYLIFYVMVIKQ